MTKNPICSFTRRLCMQVSSDGHNQREVEEKEMTNLTHLSSAHRDQCPRRRWDTRLTPPARRRLAERKQNGAMSRGRVQECSDSS